MTIIISFEPDEKGTGFVITDFADEDGVANIPKSMSWQLMRTDGTVINERIFEDCPLTVAMVTVDGIQKARGTVILSGLDLAIFGSTDNRKRIFSIQGVYDSKLGDDLPLTGECQFKINKLLGQVDEPIEPVEPVVP